MLRINLGSFYCDFLYFKIDNCTIFRIQIIFSLNIIIARLYFKSTLVLFIIKKELEFTTQK